MSVLEIFSVRYKYLKLFKCMKTNELNLVKKCYLQTIRLQIIYFIYIK